jgi:methyl-accepting chemotaxis protein
LPFAITAAALLLVGILSALTFRDLVAATENIAGDSLPAVSEALNADRDLYQALVAQTAFIDAAAMGFDPGNTKEVFSENATQARDRMNSAVQRLQGTGITAKVAGFETAYERWMAAASSSMELAESGIRQAAKARLKGESQDAFDELRDYFDLVGIHADEQAQNSAIRASDEALNRSVIILAASLITVLGCVILFFVFLGMIVGSIKTLRSQLDNIARGEGDLTQRVPIESNDDLGQLSLSFNQVLANLQGMIASIQTLSDSLGDQASQLSTAARDNNDGVTRQSDLISMVATAMNEMQSAIEEVAGNASRAADVTRHAQETGKKGGQIIHDSSNQVQTLSGQIVKAIEVIRELSENSENITSVLDVIRGVAEQTNLLALNAAIEAARAGEQGRGFAVVADEVRTLAQRTQQSTEDIQRMITALQTGVSDIVEVMEAGGKQAGETSRLATEAENELKNILESMNDIMDVNSSVASATEQQTQVAEEINRNVVTINDLASESAQRSGSISEISSSLESYAAELRQQTARFRV